MTFNKGTETTTMSTTLEETFQRFYGSLAVHWQIQKSATDGFSSHTIRIKAKSGTVIDWLNILWKYEFSFA